ncbi:helix-turn-helix transcriptional regulator [Bacillus pumilus]|uniref:XRE family transcriptional regulator n=1 Tax=Bacillus pumilus TaxID=1408 RepID=A0AAD0ML48_BACPU|nr:XRE family transcriptional regulator [Bacillus pumilus]TYS42790.1 helix-turn-helix transcriptional regulator [Bacillus pumilus]
MKYKVRSNLKDYLNSKGIKQKWLADQIGTNSSRISIWCTNNDEGFCPNPPSLPYAIALCNTLRCEIHDLFSIIKD